MAKITKAALRAEGEGRSAVFTVELDINWGRTDDRQRWEVVVRFIGADTGIRGRDDVLRIHTLTVSPDDGDRATITLDNADGSFDEDAGGSDEIVAECELHILQPDADVVRSNKVKGRF